METKDKRRQVDVNGINGTAWWGELVSVDGEFVNIAAPLVVSSGKVFYIETRIPLDIVASVTFRNTESIW